MKKQSIYLLISFIFGLCSKLFWPGEMGRIIASTPFLSAIGLSMFPVVFLSLLKGNRGEFDELPTLDSFCWFLKMTALHSLAIGLGILVGSWLA